VAAKALLAELEKNSGEHSILYLLNALTRLGLSEQVPGDWIRKTLKQGNPNEYVRRFAQEIKDGRR
jgi:hypothetical protein